MPHGAFDGTGPCGCPWPEWEYGVTASAASVLSETKELVERLEAGPGETVPAAELVERLEEARRLLRGIIAQGGTLILDAADLLHRSLVVDLRTAHGGGGQRTHTRLRSDLRSARLPDDVAKRALRPTRPLRWGATFDEAPGDDVAGAVEGSSWEVHRGRPIVGSAVPATDDRADAPDRDDGNGLDAVTVEHVRNIAQLELVRTRAELNANEQALLTRTHDALLGALRRSDLDGDVKLVLAGLLRRVLALQLGHVAGDRRRLMARAGSRNYRLSLYPERDRSGRSPSTQREVEVGNPAQATVSIPPVLLLPTTPEGAEVSRRAHEVDAELGVTGHAPALADVTGRSAMTAEARHWARVGEGSPSAARALLEPPTPDKVITVLPVKPDLRAEAELPARVPGQVAQISTALVALRAIGVVLVLFVVYAVYGSALIQGRAQRALKAASYARISAVDIGLDQLVLGSDSKSALAKGPGFAPASGILGGSSPVMIVGHRTVDGGPFRHLSALKPGDSVVVRAGDGSIFRYEVDRVVTTTPRATLTEAPGAQVLYLVSATPAYHDSGRLVVVARLVGSSRSPSPQSMTLPAFGGSIRDLFLGLVVLALLGWGWAVRSIRRQALPLWAAWGAWLPAIAMAFLSWQLLLGSMSRLL